MKLLMRRVLHTVLMLLTLNKLLTRIKFPMMPMLLTLCTEVPTRKRQTTICSPSIPSMKLLMRKKQHMDLMLLTPSRLHTRIKFPTMPMSLTLCTEVPTRKSQTILLSPSSP